MSATEPVRQDEEETWFGWRSIRELSEWLDDPENRRVMREMLAMFDRADALLEHVRRLTADPR